MKTTRGRVFLFAVVAFMFVCSVALASSGEGGEQGGLNIKGLLYQILNFGILVFILVFFGRKPIREFFRNRTESIRKGIDDAREAKELAAKALEEVKQRLAGKDDEIRKIIESSIQSGQKERERLIEEGQRLGQMLVEQAKSNIEMEVKQAKEAIKAEAAQLAMELAEKKIEGKLDAEKHRKLFEEALEKLERRN